MLQVLIEPGTPHGSRIISQMRSHILWMEKRVNVSCCYLLLTEMIGEQFHGIDECVCVCVYISFNM